MPTYSYPNDGRLHTRYSELVRCTPGQIDRVIDEKFGLTTPFSSEHTALGSVRHEMYAEEMRGSKRIPECFCKEYTYDARVDMVETELKAEILPGVVLHSTPDAVDTDNGIVFDFKVTTLDAKKWNASKQILTYAYQMHLRGVDVSYSVFLIEKWNSAKTEILGYQSTIQLLPREKVLGVLPWLQDRAMYLQEKITEYQDTHVQNV